MKKHWSYQVSIIMMGMMTFLFIFSFLLQLFISSKEYSVLKFYHSSFFFLWLLLTTLSFSIFLIYYIKSLIKTMNKKKLGSALLHMGIFLFLIFGMLHKLDYFYQENKIMMQEDRLYELNNQFYIQWKKSEERLAIIENREDQFFVVQKLPVYTNQTSKWKNYQVKQLSHEPFKKWDIELKDQSYVSIFFNTEQVLIDDDRLELIDFFPLDEWVETISGNGANQQVNPGFLLYDSLLNELVWVSEEAIFENQQVKVIKTAQEYLGILVVYNRLVSIFILASSFFTIGYVLLLLTNWKKKQVQR